MLVYFLILLSVTVIFFLVWFFYLNIYEVKFKYNFDPNDIQIGVHYIIQCKGINLLGKEIGFRDLECSYQIDAGSEIIEFAKIHNRNNFEIVFTQKGIVKLLLSSKYSLNPSLIFLQCKRKG